MEENIEIKKTEDIKSSNGTSVLAKINNEGGVEIVNEVLPSKINPYQKVEKKVNNVNKNRKKIVTPREKRHMTIISITMILLLALCGGCYYYFGIIKNPQNYTIKNVTYELGDKVSNNPRDYVNRENIDELQYTLNLDSVKEDEIGTYNYTITYKGETKKGIINIVDTKGPTISSKENIILSLNSNYNIDDFVASCSDPSGCSYDFLITPDTTIAGGYTIKIIAKDELGNETTIEVNYKVDDNIAILCTLPSYSDTINNTRVSITEKLYFNNNNELVKIIKSSNNIFFSNDKYEEFKNAHQNDNFTFNDYNFSYTSEEEISNPTSFNYKEELINYYTTSGYTCN